MIVLAIITMLGMIKFVPNVSLSAEANISKELTVFKNPHILIVIAIIVFGYSGVFTTYTFMEPMIRDFSPFKKSSPDSCVKCYTMFYHFYLSKLMYFLEE